MMLQVLELVQLGVSDRNRMAEQLAVTTRQVTSALQNLRYFGFIDVLQHRSKGYRRGRDLTVYKVASEPPRVPKCKNPLHGVSSIFHPLGVRVDE